jgi:hypothetical protein
MPRPVKQPNYADLDEEGLANYDVALKKYFPDASPGEEREFDRYHGVLLHSPAFSEWLELAATCVRTRGDTSDSYSHADRDTVDMVLCKELGTNIVLTHHIPTGLANGMRMELVKAVRYGHEEDLNEDEQLLVAFIRAVARGTLTDELWDRMVDRLGTRGAVDYTLFINFLLMTIRNLQALTVFEPSDEDVDRMIRDIESGKFKLPDPEAGTLVPYQPEGYE